jgi:hypothetical protein
MGISYCKNTKIRWVSSVKLHYEGMKIYTTEDIYTCNECPVEDVFFMLGRNDKGKVDRLW